MSAPIQRQVVLFGQKKILEFHGFSESEVDAELTRVMTQMIHGLTAYNTEFRHTLMGRAKVHSYQAEVPSWQLAEALNGAALRPTERGKWGWELEGKTGLVEKEEATPPESVERLVQQAALRRLSEGVSPFEELPEENRLDHWVAIASYRPLRSEEGPTLYPSSRPAVRVVGAGPLPPSDFRKGQASDEESFFDSVRQQLREEAIQRGRSGPLPKILSDESREAFALGCRYLLREHLEEDIDVENLKLLYQEQIWRHLSEEEKAHFLAWTASSCAEWMSKRDLKAWLSTIVPEEVPDEILQALARRDLHPFTEFFKTHEGSFDLSHIPPREKRRQIQKALQGELEQRSHAYLPYLPGSTAISPALGRLFLRDLFDFDLLLYPSGGYPSGAEFQVERGKRLSGRFLALTESSQGHFDPLMLQHQRRIPPPHLEPLGALDRALQRVQKAPGSQDIDMPGPQEAFKVASLLLRDFEDVPAGDLFDVVQQDLPPSFSHSQRTLSFEFPGKVKRMEASLERRGGRASEWERKEVQVKERELRDLWKRFDARAEEYLRVRKARMDPLRKERGRTLAQVEALFKEIELLNQRDHDELTEELRPRKEQLEREFQELLHRDEGLKRQLQSIHEHTYREFFVREEDSGESFDLAIFMSRWLSPQERLQNFEYRPGQRPRHVVLQEVLRRIGAPIGEARESSSSRQWVQGWKKEGEVLLQDPSEQALMDRRTFLVKMNLNHLPLPHDDQNELQHDWEDGGIQVAFPTSGSRAQTWFSGRGDHPDRITEASTLSETLSQAMGISQVDPAFQQFLGLMHQATAGLPQVKEFVEAVGGETGYEKGIDFQTGDAVGAFGPQPLEKRDVWKNLLPPESILRESMEDERNPGAAENVFTAVKFTRLEKGIAEGTIEQGCPFAYRNTGDETYGFLGATTTRRFSLITNEDGESILKTDPPLEGPVPVVLTTLQIESVPQPIPPHFLEVRPSHPRMTHPAPVPLGLTVEQRKATMRRELQALRAYPKDRLQERRSQIQGHIEAWATPLSEEEMSAAAVDRENEDILIDIWCNALTQEDRFQAFTNPMTPGQRLLYLFIKKNMEGSLSKELKCRPEGEWDVVVQGWRQETSGSYKPDPQATAPAKLRKLQVSTSESLYVPSSWGRLSVDEDWRRYGMVFVDLTHLSETEFGDLERLSSSETLKEGDPQSERLQNVFHDKQPEEEEIQAELLRRLGIEHLEDGPAQAAVRQIMAFFCQAGLAYSTAILHSYAGFIGQPLIDDDGNSAKVGDRQSYVAKLFLEEFQLMQEPLMKLFLKKYGWDRWDTIPEKNPPTNIIIWKELREGYAEGRVLLRNEQDLKTVANGGKVDFQGAVSSMQEVRFKLWKGPDGNWHNQVDFGPIEVIGISTT